MHFYERISFNLHYEMVTELGEGPKVNIGFFDALPLRKIFRWKRLSCFLRNTCTILYCFSFAIWSSLQTKGFLLSLEVSVRLGLKELLTSGDAQWALTEAVTRQKNETLQSFCPTGRGFWMLLSRLRYFIYKKVNDSVVQSRGTPWGRNKHDPIMLVCLGTCRFLSPQM